MSKYEGDYRLAVIKRDPSEEEAGEVVFVSADDFRMRAQELLQRNEGAELHVRSYRNAAGEETLVDGGAYEVREDLNRVCREISTGLNASKMKLGKLWNESQPAMQELRELLGSSLRRLRIRGFNEKCINSPKNDEPLRIWINTDTNELGVDEAMEQSADFLATHMAQFQEWWDAALETVGEDLDHISFSPAGGNMYRPMTSAHLTFRQGRVIDEISYFAEETETAKQ